MDTGKMGMLDTQDLTLFLTYQYVKDLKMKQLGNQIYNLGVSAGLDLENVDYDLKLEEVIGVNRNIERKSDCQDSEQHTKKLVYSYLRRNGYDVAEEFATTCNLKQTTVNLSWVTSDTTIIDEDLSWVQPLYRKPITKSKVSQERRNSN